MVVTRGDGASGADDAGTRHRAGGEGRLILLTRHVSGYRCPLPVLERPLAHAKARGGGWFATHADVVRWCKERAG